MEQALRSRGISEPALLARAAELDDKTTSLIGTAASISQRRVQASGAAKHAREASPTGRQHPARLAARDSLPAAGTATSLPRLVPISPKTGYANHTVRQAANDWLANGLEGRSAKTVTKNQNVLDPILKVIGARELRQLTAADVRQALARMATTYSHRRGDHGPPGAQARHPPR